jgi:hypothetical protein
MFIVKYEGDEDDDNEDVDHNDSGDRGCVPF